MPTRLDWMPYALSEKLALFRNVDSKIDTYKDVLPLTDEQVTRIKEICEAFIFAGTIVTMERATMKALVTWRNQIFKDEDVGQPASERPMFNNSPAPPAATRGLLAEFRQLMGLIKKSPGFSQAMGRDLNIMSPNHEKPALSEMQPLPKVTAVEGFKIKISCQMLGMTALKVEYRRQGEEKWRDLAFLTNLPATIFVEPATRGVPETGQIRCIFYDKNKTVGQYSNMPSVTLFGA